MGWRIGTSGYYGALWESSWMADYGWLKGFIPKVLSFFAKNLLFRDGWI